MVQSTRRNAAKLAVLIGAVVATAAISVTGVDAKKNDNNGRGAERSKPVQLQILALNDFHGNIASTSSSFGGVGRADYLAANIAAREDAAEGKSIFVSAGDLIGASPLISARCLCHPRLAASSRCGQ